MYKASYANGDKWYEWIKMGASNYQTMRINGDGSHTMFDTYKRKSLAKTWVQFMNDNYATLGGQQKAATMTDGHEYVTKKTLAHWCEVKELTANIPF